MIWKSNEGAIWKRNGRVDIKEEWRGRYGSRMEGAIWKRNGGAIWKLIFSTLKYR